MCALGEARRQKVVWLSTHYHDDPAAYHVEEDAATEKIFLLNVHKPLKFSAM